MGEIVVRTDDETLEGVARVHLRVERRLRPAAFLSGTIHGWLNLFGGRFQAWCDGKADLQRLPGDLIDGLADQREEIILEPDLIEFVRHTQNESVLIDFDGLDWRKPAAKQFRIEHSLQDFARVSLQLLVPRRHHSSVITTPDLFTA